MSIKNNQLLEALKEINAEYEGVHDLLNFLNGNMTRKKDGSLNIQINIPKEAFKSKTGVPMKSSDFKYRPLLLFVTESVNGQK